MQALIFRFLDICLLRAGPQDLPDSRFLLRLSIVLMIGVSLLLHYPARGLQQGMLEVLLDILLTVGLLFAALRWQGKLTRFRQSLTALMGTNALLALFAMPFAYRMIAANNSGENAFVALQFFLLILVWNITVTAHIVRHTFAIHLGYGFLVSIGYLMLYWGLGDLVFGS